jgi:hypothetical protein
LNVPSFWLDVKKYLLSSGTKLDEKTGDSNFTVKLHFLFSLDQILCLKCDKYYFVVLSWDEVMKYFFSKSN